MSEYVIGKYIRLSQDDAVSESLSIHNQRLLLDGHIAKMGIPVANVLEFVDNGYTGTNLERPAFQEMIELVRCGKIDCIIVKDFSRFARHELESGYYIEQVFPLYRVRFVSVGDGFDSNDHKDGSGGMDMAFKFLMHEYYSKDLSKKVKTALHARMQKGEHIVARAVHGYRKNEGGRWEPDPEAAEVIKRIFQMALEGNSTSQIRDKLFESRCPTPREYTLLKKGRDIVPKCMWQAGKLYSILVNEQYIGSYVSGKRESTRVGDKTIVLNDKSEWIVIQDRHPALVSKEDFARVQEMLRNPNGSASDRPAPCDHSRSCKAQMISGERKSSLILYGYVKDSGGDWAIAEPAASVVRDIFGMAQQGLSAIEIRDKLKESGCPSPSEQQRLVRGHAIQPLGNWSPIAVNNILKNEQYTGTYVAGKTYKTATDIQCRVDESEWVRIPDMHPAIISRDVFTQVQAIRAGIRKNRRRRREYLLRGKAACGCCGFIMAYNDYNTVKTYCCAHTRADPAAECHKMIVSAEELESAVMAAIRKQAEVVLGSDDLSGIRKTRAGERQAADFEKQIDQLAKRRQQCYEQFVSLEIDRDTFVSLKEDITAQIESLTSRLAAIRQMERDNDSNAKIAALAKDALSDKATPKDIVDALVEKVLVFPGNHLEIRWKFANFAENI